MPTAASLAKVLVVAGVLCSPWMTTSSVVIQDKKFHCDRKNIQREKEKRMNPQLDQEKIHSQGNVHLLRQEGFTEEEIKRLMQLRRIQAELGVSLTAAEYQRLAFMRWLVARGKLLDELA